MHNHFPFQTLLQKFAFPDRVSLLILIHAIKTVDRDHDLKIVHFKFHSQRNSIDQYNIVALFMREIEPPFEIDYQGGKVKIIEQEINEDRVFRVYIKKPMTITVAEDRFKKRFWTSIPQGRQHEAEGIGRLIAAYIRSKRK